MLWPTRRPLRLQARSTPTSSSSSHRADIQGLRAVAVLLVIADHLIDKPRGGFIGVDVFFVISGFLITGLLVREHERSGRISLATFYRRRVKRILPAAVTVLAVVVALSSVLLAPARHSGVLTDALWAALSLGNWRMIAVGTDYLHATDAVSPLQHYWSLAVEEQFYFIWPLLLIVASAALWRRGTPRRRAAAVIALLGALSLGFGAWQSAVEPTVAYFSTFVRGWELAAGALLALAAGRFAFIGPRAKSILLAGGLSTIAVGAVVIDAGSRFPVPGALLPVVGSLAVVASGIGGPARGSFLLTNGVAGWIGERSYSLYLWHFPVIIFMSALLPQHGHKYEALALAMSFLAAMFSYRFIEEPFRRRSWRSWPGLPAGGTNPARIAAQAVGLAAATAAVVVLAFASRTPIVVRPVVVDGLFASAAPSAALTQREHQVQLALGANKWPSLNPSPDKVSVESAAPEWLVDGCLGDERFARSDVATNAARCTYGSPTAPHTAVLLGDSLAISWMPGLRAALGSSWKIEVWTERGCPAVAVTAKLGDGSTAADCPGLRAAAEQHIREVRPDLTILTSSQESLARLSSGATGERAGKEWQAETLTTLRALAPLTHRLVVLDPPPHIHSASDCAAPITGPANCITAVNTQFLTVERAQREAVQALHASNVLYPSTLPWFCAADGRCPSFVGSSPTLADGRHLTAAASRSVAALLHSALRVPGALPTAPTAGLIETGNGS